MTAHLLQVMGADKKASQAAEQTVAATMQPRQETSIPSVPLVATNSVEAGPIKKKGSYAENIFDLAVSLRLLQDVHSIVPSYV